MERCPSSFGPLYQNDRLPCNGAIETTCACSLEDVFGASQGFLYARYCTYQRKTESLSNGFQTGAVRDQAIIGNNPLKG